MTDVTTSSVDTVQQTAEAIVANLSTIQTFATACGSYYTSTVNLESTITWLLQFPTPQLVTSAIQVLGRLHFVDSNKLTALLETAYHKIPAADAEKARFCAAGHYFESASLVAYEFSKHLGFVESELADRWTDISNLSNTVRSGLPLILVDDNLASGIQLRQFLSELHPDHDGPREHFQTPLDPERLAALRSVPLYAIVAVELGNGRVDVERFAQERGLNLKVFSGHTDLARWLDFGGPIWNSKQDADEFAEFCRRVARQLFVDKKWASSVLEDRLLGYGNSQKLTALFHNIPKTLLSLLWKFGKVDEHDWLPLFPERSEWKKHRASIVGARPQLRYIARLIASGGIGKTAASCSVAFVHGDDSDRGLLVDVSDAATIQHISNTLRGKLEPLDPMPEASGPLRMVTPLAPTEAQVRAYNARVAQYNRDLVRYANRIAEACDTALRLIVAPLRIYNDGTATAFEVVLTLQLPAEIDFVGAIPEIPERPEEPYRPKSSLDYQIAGLSLTPTLVRAVQDASNRRFRPTRDRGRKLLDVFVGKIVPTTFRDVNLEFLRVPIDTELTIPFRIVHEASSRPTDGTLHIATHGASGIARHIKEAWKLTGPEYSPTR